MVGESGLDKYSVTYNGGGSASNSDGIIGRSGGGATDIRTKVTSTLENWNESESLKSRIMVAAGGGGSGYYSSNSGSYFAIGGAGGGLTGYTGTSTFSNDYSIVGNQISAGASGGFGFGGNATGGGGGSGWYGGGGGLNIGAGGGGSSYISGHAGCIAVTSSGTPKIEEYSEISDSVSYTGYKFVNTQMIDGSGYPWTTIKSESSSGMPSPISSSIITGNSGNGYAKITYLGN